MGLQSRSNPTTITGVTPVCIPKKVCGDELLVIIIWALSMTEGLQSSSSSSAPLGSADPPRSEILEQLSRITSSAAFTSAEKAASFLEFVVVAVLNGRGEQLKETSIAVEFLGRDPDYDPKADSI